MVKLLIGSSYYKVVVFIVPLQGLYVILPKILWIVYRLLVLGYSGIKYRKCFEKAVFTLLLFYNLHGMSFLISSSIYQFMMNDMLSRLDVLDAECQLRMCRGQAIGLCCNLLLYTISFFVMVRIIKRIVKSPPAMSWYDTVFLSVLSVVGSMLTWMITDISAVQIDKEVFYLFTQRREMVWKIPTLAVLLCTGEISAVCIFRKYRELQSEREKHFVEKQQMKAMKRRLEEAENFYGSIRKARHEMRNHITNIKGLVAAEQYGEAERYMEKLDETMQGLDFRFSTGNAVTDIIVNDKYRRAAKSGTAFLVRFEYRETDTISAFDMGIVLNNLLENAVEACEKTGLPGGRISLSLKRRNHFLLVEVENSFDGRLNWKDGEPLPETSKQSSLPDALMEHGIGLKNVRDVAERYLGYMDIRAENGIFKVTVMLQQREIHKNSRTEGGRN